jgi:hypothetical protein
MAASGESFEVHLTELRRFAQELRIQADGLQARRGDLSTLDALSARSSLFGAFAEADTLAAVHTRALQLVSELYEQVHGMIGFADAVARDVADRYEGHDDLAGDSFAALRFDDSSRLGRMMGER